MSDWKQRLYDQYVSTGQAGFAEKQSLDSPYFDKLIDDHLPRDTGIAVLDLACGHGPVIHALKKKGYTNVLGIDISEEQVAAAHRLGLTEVKCQDLKDFFRDPGTGRYDVVFLMDILEHLDKQELFDLLDEVHGILTDGGIVVIHVPNGAGLFGMRIRYGDFTHYNAFTAQSMQQILSACRFASVEAFEDKPVAHGLTSMIRSFLWMALTIQHRLLLAAETGSFRHILSQNLLVVARKAGGSAHE